MESQNKTSTLVVVVVIVIVIVLGIWYFLKPASVQAPVDQVTSEEVTGGVVLP